MCRLFGLIANKPVNIRFSMLEARNCFKRQGKVNADGWGIGWYEQDGKSKIEKYGESAFASSRFNELVKEVISKIFIAHVRYMSSGSEKSQRNAHPFAYDSWLFAHNGTIEREKFINLLKKPYSLGLTSEPIDSELYFRWIVQCIEEDKDPIEGIKRATDELKYLGQGSRGLNFILSDGKNLYAYRGGNPLYYLDRNPEEYINASSEETEALIDIKKARNEKAVIVATEKITESENWQSIENNMLIWINNDLMIKEV